MESHSEDEVLQAIVEGISALNFDRVRLYTLSSDGKWMCGKTQFGMDDSFRNIKREVAHDKYMQQVLTYRRPHVCRPEQGETVPFQEELDKEGVDAWVCVSPDPSRPVHWGSVSR